MLMTWGLNNLRLCSMRLMTGASLSWTHRELLPRRFEPLRELLPRRLNDLGLMSLRLDHLMLMALSLTRRLNNLRLDDLRLMTRRLRLLTVRLDALGLMTLTTRRLHNLRLNDLRLMTLLLTKHRSLASGQAQVGIGIHG